MKTGYIGLGLLGSAILKNLVARGERPVIWNRTKKKTEEFSLPVADSPKDLAEKSDLILINVFDSDSVKDLLNGDGGLLKADLGGRIIVDMTTNDHKSVLEFRDILKEKNAQYLECPVIGTVPPALKGQLTMLVSGDEGPFERTRHILELIAEPVIFLPEPGASTKMKLINNLLMARIMGGIAESIVFAEKAGINRKTAIECMENGAGNSVILKGKKERLINEDYDPHFTIKTLNKDLGYVSELARDIGLIPFQDIIKLFGNSDNQELDFSAVIRDIADK